jgi:lactoylglutathione lyase
VGTRLDPAWVGHWVSSRIVVASSLGGNREEIAMKLESLTPNLMVPDVNQAIDYYREYLGFELNMSVPETGLFDWASIKAGDVEIMLQARTSLVGEIPALEAAQIGGSLTFFIQMQGIDELYHRVKDRVTIVQDMHTTPYGMREFAMRDLNGYILAFAEPV